MSSAIDGEARKGIDFLSREVARQDEAIRGLVGRVAEMEAAAGLRVESPPVEDVTPSDVEPPKPKAPRKGKGA